MVIRAGQACLSLSSVLLAGLVGGGCGATGNAVEPGVPPAVNSRPVLLTTDAMLDLARQRVEEGREPFAEAWRKTLARAERGLSAELEPYQGADYLRYFRISRDQAQITRDLAIVARVTGDSRYADRSRELLLAWAKELEDNYDFPETYPASDIRHGAGLVIGRTVVIFGDAYALLYPDLEETDRETIRRWFRKLVPPMKEELRIWKSETVKSFQPPFLDRQYFNNHLSGCTLGIAAVGFALQDPDLLDYAYGTGQTDPAETDVFRKNPRDVPTLIEGAILMPGDFGSGEEGDVWQGPPGDPSLRGAPPPAPGEIWDRYRVIQGHGVPYAILHLRLLTLMTELAHNNLGAPYYKGGDFYQFTGARGENLEVSYDLYADWFITMNMGSVNNGYYVDWIGDDIAPRGMDDFMHGLALYELAARRYPENGRIRAALKARQEESQRPAGDHETFGWTATLLYGPEIP